MAQDDHRPYYDDHVHVQIKHFIDGNRRVDRAVQRILGSVERPPKRVLEVGCGIGHVAARLAVAWPSADIVGVDTSPKSIELARRLFASERVHYHEGLLEESGLTGHFDLVVLMDALEHVPVDARASLMAVVRSLLTDDGRVVITVPTPQFLQWLRENEPTRVQPVDEDISAGLLDDLAGQLGRGLLTFERVSIWRRNDYAHAVIGDDTVAPLQSRPAVTSRSSRNPVTRLRRRRRGRSTPQDREARRALVVARLGEAAIPSGDPRIGDAR